jgi:serine protease Do
VHARGGVVSTVKSPAIISSGDLSLVASATGQVLGVARYEMRGVGQLVPISYLKDVVARRVLAARGSVESGWLGADGSWIADLPEPGRPKSATTGVVVSHLVEGGPALRAGLAVNDVIVAFDGVPVGSLVDLGTLVRSTPAGSSVPIAFVRDGKSMTVDAELGRRPASGAMRLAPTSPDFGLSVLDLNAQLAEFLGVSNGVFVQFVREGTPAGSAGLRAGDVITMVGDTPIANRLAFNSALVDAPSSTVKLAVHREKSTIFLTVSLAAPK